MSLFAKKNVFSRDQLRLFNGNFIAEFIEKNPTNYDRNSVETKDLTLLALDIRAMSILSEALTAEYLVELLNDFHEYMGEAIYSNNGEIIHLQGDSVFACFGLTSPETSAADACKAALVCSASMVNISKELEANISLGIGINSGKTFVGIYGSKYRRQFTCIGDTMNLTSRLQGTNPWYGTDIIISESTRDRLTPDIQVRELDSIRIKGNNNPMKIFELISSATCISR